MERKKVILIIMDGWGIGKKKSADAIQNAHVPFVTSLYSKYPNTTLVTCGEAVGLPLGRSGDEVALPGAEEHRRALETCHRMASCLRAVHHLLPGALANYNPLTINPPWIARTQAI